MQPLLVLSVILQRMHAVRQTRMILAPNLDLYGRDHNTRQVLLQHRNIKYGSILTQQVNVALPGNGKYMLKPDESVYEGGFRFCKRSCASVNSESRCICDNECQ